MVVSAKYASAGNHRQDTRSSNDSEVKIDDSTAGARLGLVDQVVARDDPPPPRLVLLIPGDGGLQPAVEAPGGPPVQLTLDPGGVDSVATVVRRPVGHPRDQR